MHYVAHLATMSSLTCLGLSNTSITDAGIKKLTVLQSLQVLDISKTDISDDCLKLIAASFPDLIDLHLADCSTLSDEGLVLLANLKKLNYVTVSRGQFSSNALSKLRLSRWTPAGGEEISIQER